MKSKRKGVGAKFNKLRKKKSFWIILILIILIIAGTVVFFVMKNKARAAAETVTVQEVSAAIGNVSNTIDSTGTVSNGSSSDVSIPVGVKVNDVLVAAGDTVEAGQNLASVDTASVATVLLKVRQNIDSVEDDIDNLSSDADDSSTEEYLEKIVLENTLAELNSQKTLLSTMLSSGYIVATEGGVVNAVSVSDGSEVASVSAASTASGSTSGTTSDSSTGSSGAGASAMSSTDEYTISFLENNTSDEANAANIANPTPITMSDLSGLKVTAPATGATPQTSISTGTDKCTGTISWDCTGKYQSGEKYTATITLTAADQYTFTTGTDYPISIAGATIKNSAPTVYESAGTAGNKLVIVATFEKTAASSSSGSSASGNVSNGSASGSSTSGNSTSGNASNGSTSGTSGSTGSTSGSSTNGSGSTGTTTSSTGTTVSSEYAVENGIPFSVASGSDVVISVAVDELDINSISNGQTATVTLDALEEQEFEGTVTSISSTATTTNGSSTYAVEITLGKEEGMKVGMSASTTINIEEVTDVVTIPVIALQESHGSSFVYTEKDDQGNLSGEVEVETGLSDGGTVEIKSGLSKGDTVYYQKTESDSETSEFQMGGGMGGESSGDRSEMKQDMDNGGTPPSGGAPSGN